MPKKRKSYGRPLHDAPANAVLSEIEEWQGRVPHEFTPLALQNLHEYIVWLEDTVTQFRRLLSERGGGEDDIGCR